jgi:nitrate reductase gamma subunit
MIMTALLFLICYLAAVVFVVACLVRIASYARAPIHLRWELYPVPHEDPSRVKHGGSRFEEADGQAGSAHSGLMGELRFMIPEMLFLKGLYDFNRKLWYRSFPFHFGLYLLFATLGLLLVAAALSILAPGSASPTLVGVLRFIYPLTGSAGFFLAVAGASGLLARRLADENLKSYTTPGDVFNLLVFIVTLGTLAVSGFVTRPPEPDMLAIIGGMLTFNTSLNIPALSAAGWLLAAFLMAYIPLTHMSHFIAKYFTYHSVRWDDVPNPKGGKLEARVAEYLTYRPTWAASHVGADGRKTWAEVAASRPASEAEK